jgi:hypothetical protein
VEGSENAASKNLRAFFIISGTFTPNYHGFVLAVHSEAHNIVTRHSRELLGHYVLEVDEVAHGLESLVVLNHHELNLALVFFPLDLGVSFEVALVGRSHDF